LFDLQICHLQVFYECISNNLDVCAMFKAVAALLVLCTASRLQGEVSATAAPYLINSRPRAARNSHSRGSAARRRSNHRHRTPRRGPPPVNVNAAICGDHPPGVTRVLNRSAESDVWTGALWYAYAREMAQETDRAIAIHAATCAMKLEFVTSLRRVPLGSASY